MTCANANLRSALSKIASVLHFIPDAEDPAGIIARSHAQVAALFGKLSLVPPGVVPVAEWRPVMGHRPQPADMYAGLAVTGSRGWMA